LPGGQSLGFLSRLRALSLPMGLALLGLGFGNAPCLFPLDFFCFALLFCLLSCR
jgi:hypothetical protein